MNSADNENKPDRRLSRPKEVAVLDFKSDGTWTYETMKVEHLLFLGQEKSLEVFHSSNLGTLRLRDIRLLMSDNASSEPIVVVRMLCILLSLNLVRALILPDRMLMFIPDGADAMISLITSKVKELSSGIGESQIPEASMAMKDEQEWSNIHVDAWNLDGWIENAEEIEEKILINPRPERNENQMETIIDTNVHVSFELWALESVLWTSTALLQKDYEHFKPEVAIATKQGRKDHSEKSLDSLRRTQETAKALLSRASRDVSALAELVINDRDLALMCFSKVMRNPERYRYGADEATWIHDHDEVEAIVQTYIQRIDSIIHDI